MKWGFFIGISLLISSFEVNADNLGACARTTANGGLESAIVRVALPFTNKPDPNPCDQDENESHGNGGAGDVGAGGGGGGTGGDTGRNYGGGSYYGGGGRGYVIIYPD